MHTRAKDTLLLVGGAASEREGLRQIFEDKFYILEAENAIDALEGAKTAREISRANQTLTGAVSELAAAENLGQDEAYMRRAADEFTELGSFLRQEARAYNEKAEKAVRLYEKLPTKFMLSQPDIYEGL